MFFFFIKYVINTFFQYTSIVILFLNIISYNNYQIIKYFEFIYISLFFFENSFKLSFIQQKKIDDFPCVKKQKLNK
jgi:hypothetical protein